MKKSRQTTLLSLSNIIFFLHIKTLKSIFTHCFAGMCLFIDFRERFQEGIHSSMVYWVSCQLKKSKIEKKREKVLDRKKKKKKKKTLQRSDFLGNILRPSGTIMSKKRSREPHGGKRPLCEVVVFFN